MRISDWSSDVCSSDLALHENPSPRAVSRAFSASLGSDDIHVSRPLMASTAWRQLSGLRLQNSSTPWKSSSMVPTGSLPTAGAPATASRVAEAFRSEEHTSELQSLMRISYAVFALNKQTQPQINNTNQRNNIPQLRNSKTV